MCFGPCIPFHHTFYVPKDPFLTPNLIPLQGTRPCRQGRGSLESEGEESSEKATHGGEHAGSTLGRVNGRGAVARATVGGRGLLGLLARGGGLLAAVGGLLAAVGGLGLLTTISGLGLLTAVGRLGLLTTIGGLGLLTAILGEAGAVGLDLLDNLDCYLLEP